MMQDTILKTLHPGLPKLISEKGWESGLSDIQVKAIPLIMEGHDCIIEAPTAGGKTEAVLFPTLTRASANKKNSIQVLYLAPLRALLNNIELRAVEYAATCGLHAFKWQGDVDQKEKIKQLQTTFSKKLHDTTAFRELHGEVSPIKKLSGNNHSGLGPAPQLLLTTPESLEAILLRKTGWEKFFSGLEVVIIDEAHNFASGDRGGHLLSLLERLEKAVKSPFQRIALTAPIGNPEELLKWLAGPNRDTGQTISVTSKREKEKDYLVQYFDKTRDEGVPPEQRSHSREFNALYELLPNRKSIIFGKSHTNTEELAAAIKKTNQLKKAKNPVKVRTHHTPVSKYFREEAETLIKVASETGLQAIISTSTLELGIDIGELDLVIQAGSLLSPGSFLQRVGRTGRRETKKQFFRGLCHDREDLVLLTAVINLGLRGESESIRLSRKSYHLLAHQLICLCLQHYGIRAGDAREILSGAYCYSDISFEKFQTLVQSMIEKKYLREVDGELVAGETTERVFLGSNWMRLFASFDSAPMYAVLEGKNQVGTLDSSFVEALSVPFLFVLGGIEWKAKKVNTKRRQVIAVRTKIGNAPKWHLFRGQDVPRETAKEAGALLFSQDYPEYLDEEARQGIEAMRNEVSGIQWQKGKWVIAASDSGKAFIWTFAGDRINRTLALMLTREGIGDAKSNYKRIEIKSDINNRDELSETILGYLVHLKELDPSNLEAIEEALSKSLRRTVFSKFAKCLPDNLWGEAMAERVLDIEGLLKELRNSDLLKHSVGIIL